MSFKHVLITTDFSKESLAVLEYLNLNTILSQEFTLLYVLTDWDVPAGYYEIIPNQGQLEAWREKARQVAHEKLNALVREYAKSRNMNGVVLQSKHQAALEISNYALEHHCDLLLMGSKGAGAVASLVLGSVVQKVLRKSPCPMLIIPADLKIPNLDTSDDL